MEIKRTTEPVKIKFKKKDGSEVFIDATKITTKPVMIKFEKTPNKPKTK